MMAKTKVTTLAAKVSIQLLLRFYFDIYYLQCMYKSFNTTLVKVLYRPDSAFSRLSTRFNTTLVKVLFLSA